MPRYCTNTQYKQAHDDVLVILQNPNLDNQSKLDIVKKRFSVIVSILNHKDKSDTNKVVLTTPVTHTYAESIYSCQRVLDLKDLSSSSKTIIVTALNYVDQYLSLYYGSTSTEDTFEESLDKVLKDIRELLLAKNRKYGNSALEPIRVFSRADPVEQIRTRLDDKLSRLRNQQPDEDEDVIQDILGYLILLKIAQKTV